MINEFEEIDEEIETLRCLLAGSRDRIKFLQGEIARFESIFEPTHLMCLRGGEKLLELCAPDGTFIGVSWNDMAQVLAAMVQASPIGSGKAPKIVDSLQADNAQLKARCDELEKDREALEYLMGQFEVEVCVCDRCYDEKEMKDSDSANYLRRYLSKPAGSNSHE
ncbi:Uncharacterized protein ALO80_04330 [Pseudomonas caricapapayae]|uniref:Uncharacterized protein n=1 Tax=Pseudomonas caricapapayae TaxID=46678 RepID=A0A0P9K960_9PSED|nr:hypothetical protein [Pseudomonas caricapapayae]KPW58691.1 Uncharacterized protein ALO80_04330 [Pseudomonas caricapapayae]RMM12348.1 hypothetical protein ALQ84_04417 [Pseudomonas caricapapayae]